MKNTSTTKLDLVTHPVRLRIILALANVERTAQQIAATMTDVPSSSIYRHLQKLLDAGVVEVVAERPVRGAVEKTLRVVPEAAYIGAEDATQLQPDDHRRLFILFFTQLFQQFDQYLQRPDFDPMRDLVGFRTAALWATDAEWMAAIQQIGAVLQPLLANSEGDERKLRQFASVSLLAPNEPKEHTS